MEQFDDQLRALADVDPDILAVDLVDLLEVGQRLDLDDVLAAENGNLVASVLQDVVNHEKSLINVPPELPRLAQPLHQSIHHDQECVAGGYGGD